MRGDGQQKPPESCNLMSILIDCPKNYQGAVMGKITKSIPHLSKEEIQERIKATVGFWRVPNWLVILNALVIRCLPGRSLSTPDLRSNRFTI